MDVERLKEIMGQQDSTAQLARERVNRHNVRLLRLGDGVAGDRDGGLAILKALDAKRKKGGRRRKPIGQEKQLQRQLQGALDGRVTLTLEEAGQLRPFALGLLLKPEIQTRRDSVILVSKREV